MLNPIIDYVTELCFDVIKNKLTEKHQNIKIKQEIKKFAKIEFEAKFQHFDFTNEIDYGGLCNYVEENLLNEVKLFLFTAKYEKRDIYLEIIIEKAIIYSNANTNENKHIISLFISNVLSIVEGYYLGKLDGNYYLLKNITVDDILSSLSPMHKSIIDKLDSLPDIIVDKVIEKIQTNKQGYFDESLSSTVNIDKKKSLRWLHLSDLHFGSNDLNEHIYASLLHDIVDANNNNKIDCVFITGDIIYKGQHEMYEKFSTFLNNLVELINIDKNSIFCVSGNHDVVRNTLDSTLSNMIEDSQEAADFLESQYSNLFMSKFQYYNDFISKNFSWAECVNHKSLFYTKNILLNEIKIGIVGINSSWAQNYRDESVVIGEQALIDAFSKIEPSNIVIAILHHPLSKIRNFEQRQIINLLNNRCDFVLHGHSHYPIRIENPYNESYYISAGSSFENYRETLTYNYVTIDLNQGESYVTFRKYNHETQAWNFDTSPKNHCDKIPLRLPLRLSQNHLEKFINDKKEQYSNSSHRYPNYFKTLEESEPDVPQPPNDLLKAIQNNECILFAGAGASADAKLPTWMELVYGMTNRLKDIGKNIDIHIEEIDELLQKHEYIILADYCKNALGDYDFAEYIRDKLSIVNGSSLTHELLAKIPFSAAITTNFDAFIESTHEHNEMILPDDFENDNIIGLDNFCNENRFPILKVHGSYNKPNSIILTKNDFRNILFNKPKYKNRLKQLFLNKLIFFYGYSFKDPDIDLLLQEVMAEHNGKSRRHYALMPDVKEIYKNHLENEYNIRVISYETWSGSHIIANKFLKKIIENL